MKKFYFLILFALIASAATFADAAEKTVTYTFTSAKWEATNDSGATANWEDVSCDGSWNSSESAIQLTSEKSATATCPDSYDNISKVVVTYFTNASKGAGSVTIYGGGETSGIKQSITKPSKDGKTPRELTFDFNTKKSGKIKLHAEATQNSIYIQKVAITYDDGVTRSEAPTFSVEEGTYTTAQTVALTTKTEGANIYYKINDATDYTVYSEPISLSEEGTYKISAYTEATDTTEQSLEVTNTYVLSFPLTESYKLCKNVTDIKDGSKIIFVATKDSKDYGMSKQQNQNNRSIAEVTITDNTLTWKSLDIAVFTVGKSNGNYTFYTDDSYDSDGTVTGFLYAASSSANQLKTQATIDTNAEWTITLASDGAATITAQGSFERNQLQLNKAVNSDYFSCYSTSQTLPYIYILPSTSSVSKVAASEGVKVMGAEGGVVVSADKATDVMVYTIAGQLVSKSTVAAGTSTVSVAPGFYVVRAAGTAAKVVVK